MHHKRLNADKDEREHLKVWTFLVACGWKEQKEETEMKVEKGQT